MSISSLEDNWQVQHTAVPEWLSCSPWAISLLLPSCVIAGLCTSVGSKHPYDCLISCDTAGVPLLRIFHLSTPFSCPKPRNKTMRSAAAFQSSYSTNTKPGNEVANLLSRYQWHGSDWQRVGLEQLSGLAYWFGEGEEGAEE